MQEWQLVGYTIRARILCDLPPPETDEVQVRDREDDREVNPFPDLFERNEADSTEPNLLEESMGYPQEEE